MIPRWGGALLCALAMAAGCASNPFPAPAERSRSTGTFRQPDLVQANRPAQPAGPAKVQAQEVKTQQASASGRDAAYEVASAVALSDGRNKTSTVIRASGETASGKAAADETAVTMAASVAEDTARRSPPDPAQASGARSGEAEPLPSGAVVLSLDNVLQMAEAQNPQIAVARERINEAYAHALRAEAAWLPSLRTGLNYNHHEGTIQDVAGTVFPTNRSALYGGLGANAVGAGSPAVPGVLAQFHFADALFQPAIADHQAAARRFGATAVRNDMLRDAAIAYLELVRAEHADRITQEAVENTERLGELTRQFAEVGQGLNSDYTRMQAEVTLRQSESLVQQEAIQVASARLAELLHANAGVLIVSGEPTVAPLEILNADGDAAGLVADGLLRRPELAEQKHLVCAAVERLRREQYAPLVPSVLLGVSYGAMGGGLGSTITNTGDRWDADAVAFWELRNLGLGEQAARQEMASQARQARLQKVALLDSVAREVVEAHARVSTRRGRIAIAQEGIVAAEKSYRLNRERIENAQGLPIEVLQSVQALSTARRAYLDAVTDYNVAQFQLCHATGVLVR